MTRPALIVLWAVPRSRSTAFELMMRQRGDVEVVHEPFSYLVSGGSFTLAGRTATALPELLGLLLARAADRTVFVKDTTDHPYDPLPADPRLLREVTNTFLVRDPDAVVASYHAMKPTLDPAEVGFDRLHALFTAVRAATGRCPVVLDADDLVRDPAGMAGAYCRQVGLPPRPDALRWPAGTRPEWTPTAPWHSAAAASTGFRDGGRTYPVHPGNDERLAAIARRHRPYYAELHACRIVPARVGPGSG